MATNKQRSIKVGSLTEALALMHRRTPGKPGSVFNWTVHVDDLDRYLMGADVPVKGGRLLLRVLLQHQNIENGTLIVTTEALSREAGVPIRTIYRRLTELQDFLGDSFKRILYPGEKKLQVRRQINIHWFGVCQRLLPLQKHYSRDVTDWNFYWKVIEKAVLETQVAEFTSDAGQGKDCQNTGDKKPESLFLGSPSV
jgi:hypothetical protein